MKIYKNMWMFLSLFGLLNCTQSDFLDVKPNSGILVPHTLDDVQKLLNNNIMQTISSGLATVSADEYVIDEANWKAAPAIERNASVWNSDIYEGEGKILDWNVPYQVVFYVNNALTKLSEMDKKTQSTKQYKELKGWSLFKRAYANYELTRLFCKIYDERTASADLGIPIRTTADIDVVVQRSSVEDTYAHILADIQEAIPLLSTERTANLLKPNRTAAYSLLARIYLDMGKYTEAENYADSALNLYNVLLDYNTLNLTTNTPFSPNNVEIIYSTMTVGRYQLTITGFFPQLYKIDPKLIDLYAEEDLRSKIYFMTQSGVVVMKRAYNGLGSFGFTGLATDELYLIKAECLARKSKDEEALGWMHSLLQKRYATGKVPTLEFLRNKSAVLELILEERRKELVWRSIRWSDIKRLNRDGKQITLKREIGDKIHTLLPDDPKYIFPIPDDEIAFSGLIQNRR
ncbi:RagB/SusD family nutrient uptake outer membrane protein [Sphingobacterium yanglingense]|uniref:SusD-like starch-binding protein associating with outer membrane n=1 Tax=Sphingobacterium yanglingense TaxID=1437280 RepID=A0A4R6WKL1_9SPHI|nr:RagB/SusD family nutrient uptake outer membrane protein [Sphingobacterium yanglingense]TDQ81076.1 SusD-like starch-binding protein associating with outer membrane [Sphingobacterium yanglingense]